ncbi:MAG: glycosyltransferase [Polaromonas sp.]|nr:glycosyltransferase [Polaromonas sp.]
MVYFSPVPWFSFTQRPHKYVQWFHERTGGKVLWVDPYPTRFPVLSDFQNNKSKLRKSSDLIGATITPDWLTLTRARALPIEPLPGSGWVNGLFWRKLLQQIDLFLKNGNCQIVVGKPSELALRVLDRYPGVFSIYDAMDDFPAFYHGFSKQAMARREQAVAARVSQVLVSSTMLAERFSGLQSRPVITLNACAIESLPFMSEKTQKPVQAVLGYVGTMGHWFDWKLVFSIARANPSMCIRLIGPVYTAPPAGIPLNIQMLPACDHASAILWMQGFSVGLIPFLKNELTASVDPIKYYEYFALGLPVLSTRFGEMALRDGSPGVFLVDSEDNLAFQVETALTYKYRIEDINIFRIKNSWESRFDKIDFIAEI